MLCVQTQTEATFVNAMMGTLVVVTIAQVSVIDARECSERADIVISTVHIFSFPDRYCHTVLFT